MGKSEQYPSLKSELNVEKDWVGNSDYLLSLSDLVVKTGIENLDSNLLYEVAYAKTYISIVKSKDSVMDSQVLNDCEALFDEVLSTTNYDKVCKLKLKSYKNLLRCKYQNEENRCALVDPPYRERDSTFVLINMHAPKIFFAMAFWFFIATGGIQSIQNFITQFSTKVVSKLVGSSNLPGIEFINSTFSTLIMIVVTLISCVMLSTIMLDLAYIVTPIVRVTGLFDRIVTEKAKDIVASEASVLEVTKEIKDHNRISRNKEWLNAMIDVEKVSDGAFFVDGYTLKSIKKKIEKGKGSGYYLALAQVEFLHNKFLEFCEAAEQDKIFDAQM